MTAANTHTSHTHTRSLAFAYSVFWTLNCISPPLFHTSFDLKRISVCRAEPPYSTEMRRGAAAAVAIAALCVTALFVTAARGGSQSKSIPPEKEAKIIAQLNRIEHNLDRLAKDHSITAKDVRRTNKAIARIHGEENRHYRTHSDLHMTLTANHKAHQIAVVCAIINIRKHQYPPALAWEERMKKRHGLVGVDYDFCTKHAADYAAAAVEDTARLVREGPALQIPQLEKL